MKNGEASVRDRLREHLYEFRFTVEGEAHFNRHGFAKASPFDLPDREKLEEEYADLSFAEMRALYEHSRESLSNYFNQLNAYVSGDFGPEVQPGEAVWNHWRQYCLLVVRTDALSDLLTTAAINGPGSFREQAEDVLSPGKSRVSKRSTKTEIAAHIINELEGRDEPPQTKTGLLRSVDDRRGKEHDTTYRYLWENVPEEKRDSISALEKWAYDQM